MKKCPTCGKTYEDSMRFCQVDGAPLVDDEPAFDPYATIVARSPKLAEPAKPAEPEMPAPAEPAPSIGEPSDVLDLPGNDPLKTMYVSDEEMKAALGGSAGSEVVDLEPAAEESSPESISQPEPPTFPAPEVPAPSFQDLTPPPSPFGSGGDDAEQRPVPPPSADQSGREPDRGFDEAATMIAAPIPVPFAPEARREPEPEPAPSYEPEPPPAYDPQPLPAYEPQPPASPFSEPTPMASSPFDTPPAAPAAQWSPPPAPDASWQDQPMGSNTPFQTPPAGVASQSKTLAIVSLVCGILSLICCNWFIIGLAAMITGFMARSKARSNPSEYGGEGLALGGIITGGISLLLGVVFWILYLLGFMATVFSGR